MDLEEITPILFWIEQLWVRLTFIYLNKKKLWHDKFEEHPSFCYHHISSLIVIDAEWRTKCVHWTKQWGQSFFEVASIWSFPSRCPLPFFWSYPTYLILTHKWVAWVCTPTHIRKLSRQTLTLNYHTEIHNFNWYFLISVSIIIGKNKPSKMVCVYLVK